MILLPFLLDEGERGPSQRPWAVAGVVFVVLMISSLWYVGAISPWSPNFEAQPLRAAIVFGTTTGPVAEGARLFYEKGCLNCHRIASYGGLRGPGFSPTSVMV